MAAEWAESNSMSLPAIVSSSDLFDGELFGDELIDIYNSTVGDDGGEGGVDHGISHLLASSEEQVKKDDDQSNANFQMATNSVDDGLGAFRPSTSFNDLTTLLGPATDAVANATELTFEPTSEISVLQNPVKPENVPSTIEVTKSGTKKRGASSAAPHSPSPKRKATGGRSPKRVSVSKKTASISAPPLPAGPPSYVMAPAATPATSGAVATAAAFVEVNSTHDKGLVPTEEDTPDPLSLERGIEAAMKAADEIVDVSPIVKASNAISEVPSGMGSSSASVASTTSSDADYKAIAQQAVSDLILNAVSPSPDAMEDQSSKDQVDTSTDHIKALTGNNWVTACNSVSDVSPAPPLNDAKSNNRARRQNLTPDERARQNRDRNREHARNTRLRKKAYVEELKRTLTELVAQREAAEFEKRQATQRELEQREVRFRVIEEFLKLRGRNETNFARWATILEDGFYLTLPVTDYRPMVKQGTYVAFEQTLDGVSDVMADSSQFSTFLQTIGNAHADGSVSFQYSCDRKNFFMDGCTAVLEWTATTVGALAKGSPAELVLKGTVRGKFSPASNKLLSAAMSFDCNAVKAQLAQFSMTDGARGCPSLEDINAQVAANQADALLDSLQMPRLTSSVPTAVTVVHGSSSSESSPDDKVDLDSDESVGDGDHANADAALAAAVVSGTEQIA